jgi:hypothetical protein
MLAEIYNTLNEKLKKVNEAILGGHVSDWVHYNHVTGLRNAYNDALQVIREVVEAEQKKQKSEDTGDSNAA